MSAPREPHPSRLEAVEQAGIGRNRRQRGPGFPRRLREDFTSGATRSVPNVAAVAAMKCLRSSSTTSSALDNLHDDSVRVSHMKPELHVLLRRQAVLLQLLGGDVPVEILDAITK